MSVSRRFFVKAGTLAVIAAAVSCKPSWAVLGQDRVEKMGAAAATDPLANYTQATFAQYVNSIFTLHSFNGTVEVSLMKVEDTLPAKTSRTGGRESFVLVFRGGGASLPQNTYTVEHPALGAFSLFLVPSGADENGAHGYTAVINRLAYTAKPLPGGLRKPLGRKRGTITPGEIRPPQGIPEVEQIKPPKKGSRDPEGFAPRQLDY